MTSYDISNFDRGWFVGNFFPTIHRTEDFEVAIKKYREGEKEERHYHKIAKEITAIISGKVKMNGIKYDSDDIIVIEPGEDTDFEALEDVVTLVIKIPSAMNDKYLGANLLEKIDDKIEDLWDLVEKSR